MIAPGAGGEAPVARDLEPDFAAAAVTAAGPPAVDLEPVLEIPEIDQAKLAMRAYLQSVDPPRAVPRVPDFYERAVEALWASDVTAAQDLATLPPDCVRAESPGVRGLIEIARKHAAVDFAMPMPEVPRLMDAGSSVARVNEEGLSDRELKEQMLLFQRLVLGKDKDKDAGQAGVDMAAELEQLGLGALPFLDLPPGEAVDLLKHKADKLVKCKKSCPFVDQKLEPFLPRHAQGALSLEDLQDKPDESETMKAMQKVMGVRHEKKSLSFLQVLEATMRYVLAGVVCGQFNLCAGWAHIVVLLQVASEAVKAGGRHSVAVSYDRLVREKWAAMAYASGSSGKFDINAAMMVKDDEVFKAALKADESHGKPSKPTVVVDVAAPSKPPRFEGNCGYCGKKGHRKFECWAYQAMLKNGAADATEEPPAKKPRRGGKGSGKHGA